MRRAVFPAALLLASCSFNPTGGGAPGDDGDGGVTDAAVTDATDASPFDGPVDAAFDACVPLCVNGNIESCGAVVETCAIACSTTGGVHCQEIVPSNGVSTEDDLLDADADMVLSDGRLYLFNTDSGEIRHFPLDGSGGGVEVRPPLTTGLHEDSRIRYRTAAQAAPQGSQVPPELAYFGMKNLTVPGTSILRAVGTRGLVLVARGAVVVAGEIDVGGGRVSNAQGAASPTVAGPGGGRGALNNAMPSQGCAAGGNGRRYVLGGNQERDTGGGGGGLGTTGGDGGQGGFGSPGGSSVEFLTLLGRCAQTNLVPLRGGSGGGCSREGSGTDVTAGGGGGGALQITSYHSVTVSGRLYAGGAGGASELEGGGSQDGGGGAGAGGGILVEAPTISVTAGSITATGGGGGAGNGSSTPGQNGQRSGVAATGGQAAAGNTHGGRGATGLALGDGEVLSGNGGGDFDGTGGGGGGAGIIHFRARTPATVGGGAVVRPAPGTSVPTVAP